MTLFFGRDERCAAAVVGQGGCRLTAFVHLKHQVYSSDFALDRYPAPSPEPNPYFAIYIYICLPSSNLDPVNFPNHIPYSAKKSTVVVLHRFLSNRAHLKNIISTLSASCSFCNNQCPAAGLACQPGYTNHVPSTAKI